MTRPRIYIAGPYSAPTPAAVEANVRRALDAAEQAWALGAAPFVPHLSHFWHLVYEHAYEDWLELDGVWLAQCQALWRLPGKSKGADWEVEYAAVVVGIPVLSSLEQVRTWLAQQEVPC